MRRCTNLLLGLALCWALPAQPFDLQGHRGARGLAPENTLAGFDMALAIGVTTLELDAGITKDGVVVVSHDRRLNPNLTRDAKGRWLESTGPAIASLTLAQLRRYDVGRLQPGTRYAQSLPQQLGRDGERIPTLAALFERVAAAGDTRVRFSIETKLSPLDADATTDPSTFARKLIEVVRAHGMQSRVTIQSFDWRTLREVRRRAPGIPTACLTARQNSLNNVDDPRWTAGLDVNDYADSVPLLVKAAGCDIWSPFFADLDDDFDALAQARSLGLKTVVWTVNERADIEHMLDVGVDGIISDYPERVREAMKARGMPLPEPSAKR